MTMPSAFDIENFPRSRKFVNDMREIFISNYINISDVICDVGNQEKNLPGLSKHNVLTLDITAETEPDIIADITRYNKNIKDDQFDALMCTEVLEHVVDPFGAIDELNRIVKAGGHILFTTPLNARIHGPVPDCWRFTEFGLRVMFRDFDVVELRRFDTPGRNLFPLHYGAIVRKRTGKFAKSDPREIRFEKVD